MAKLSATQRDDVAAEIGRLFSGLRQAIPVTRGQLRTFIDTVDDALDAAEAAAFAAIPPGALRTWILANQTLGRYVLETIAATRRELL